MRYANLAIVLVFRLVSSKVKARFPDYDSLVDAKLLLPAEAQRMVKAELQTPHEATWTPILWATKMITHARNKEKISIDPASYNNLLNCFDKVESANR